MLVYARCDFMFTPFLDLVLISQLLLNLCLRKVQRCATLKYRRQLSSSMLGVNGRCLSSRRVIEQRQRGILMHQILLSRNQIVIIDDEDFSNVSQHRWCYRAERNGSPGYAICHAKIDGKVRTKYLHREIMNPPPGFKVIFLNHDRLDCRRVNLRVVTTKEARRHHRVRSDGASDIKGVRYNSGTNTWSACTYRNGKFHLFGQFLTHNAAMNAHESAMTREDPDVANAPAIVKRSIANAIRQDARKHSRKRAKATGEDSDVGSSRDWS